MLKVIPMKNMLQIRLFLTAIVLAVTLPLAAQVSGISYTLSPAAHYTFWDDQAGLGDGLLAGGHLGIGFGEMVELRGLYLFDLGLKTNFEDYGLGAGAANLAERDVNLTRYGGEVKLNLGRSTLLPFLTLGAGVQTLELDGGAKNEHIYASGGLGITLSVADRFTFKLEGKNTAFNFNPVRNFLNDEERNDLALNLDDFRRGRLSNWSVGAGLAVFLGGRRPGTLTDVDRAYSDVFNKGFRNLSLLVEPTLAKINFADELAYRDMWLGGASVGLDFGPLVGMRLFYLKGMENDEISLDFDDIAVWGADFRFRLTSVTSGLSPFISLGGGYIDTQDEYIGRDDRRAIDSQAFASGGGGLSLNLSRNLRITGTYKALLTTSSDVEDLASTDQIRTSGQWSAGINLVFGKKAKRPDAMFTSVAQDQMVRQRAEATLEQQAALADQAKKNAEATRQLKNDYEVKIYALNEELETARAKRDTVAMDSLLAAIEQTEEVVAELDTREKDLEKTATDVETESSFLKQELDREVNMEPTTFNVPATVPTAVPQNNGGMFRGRNADGTPAPSVSRLSFTPAEFEGLIEEIFEGLNYGMPAMQPGQMAPMQYDVETENGMASGRPAATTQDNARINQMERQIADLQSTVTSLADKQDAAEKARIEDKKELREEMKASTQSILEEIRAMRTDLNNKSDMTDKEREKMKKEAEKNAEETAKEAAKAAKDAEKAAKDAAKAEEKRLKEEAKRKKKEGGQ